MGAVRHFLKTNILQRNKQQEIYKVLQLNFDINQTTIVNRKIDITTQISFSQSTISNKWTVPIILNFSVVFVSIIMLFLTFIAFLIRFLKE